MLKRARPTVVLTDDHPAVLAAAGGILEAEFDIVATAADGMHALEAVQLYKPELLVLDISMPGWSGFETAERALRCCAATKLLFLTLYEDCDYIDKARELGAGYVLKRRMRSDLLPAAIKSLEGSRFIPGKSPDPEKDSSD
jgi:two-component system, NarL family, nitrate/nitrite response regulator NarL